MTTIALMFVGVVLGLWLGVRMMRPLSFKDAFTMHLASASLVQSIFLLIESTEVKAAYEKLGSENRDEVAGALQFLTPIGNLITILSSFPLEKVDLKDLQNVWEPISRRFRKI